MNLSISGRNFPVTEALRQTVENSLQAVFEGKSLKITSATAVLSVEKSRCRADIVVMYKNHEAAASAEGFDMYKVIDDAVAKIDTQLVKFLSKVQTHQATPLRDVTAPETSMPIPEP